MFIKITNQLLSLGDRALHDVLNSLTNMLPDPTHEPQEYCHYSKTLSVNKTLITIETAIPKECFPFFSCIS